MFISIWAAFWVGESKRHGIMVCLGFGRCFRLEMEWKGRERDILITIVWIPFGLVCIFMRWGGGLYVHNLAGVVGLKGTGCLRDSSNEEYCFDKSTLGFDA